MSRENVEVTAGWMAALNRRDLSALLEIADQDVEYASYLASVSGGEGAYRGHDGIRQFLCDLAEAWDWFKVGVDELRDIGEYVLMVGRLQARGRTSGLEVEKDLAWILDFRDGTGPGRFTRVRYFPTVAEALEAVGASD
jgi:ketosteroid isomerase-like protein